MKRVRFVIAIFAFWMVGRAAAADLHPIIQVQNGYLFGATSDGKWIKAEQAAKTLTDEATYRIYGLTEPLGEAKGGEAKSGDLPCEEQLFVMLSQKPKKGLIALAAPWNALPRTPQLIDPTQKVYVDAVRDFLKTKQIKDPKVKIENILRVDLDGDGKEEALISATNYFTKDHYVPMWSQAGSYSMVVLFRVTARKVETQLVEGEFYPKTTSYNAPNSYKVVAILDLDGDGKMEVVVASQYYEGEATTIYRCNPKKVEELLSVACGA